MWENIAAFAPCVVCFYNPSNVMLAAVQVLQVHVQPMWSELWSGVETAFCGEEEQIRSCVHLLSMYTFFQDLVRLLMKYYSLAQKLVMVTMVSVLQKREVNSGKLL